MRNRGFTLIELLIVLAIIGIIAAIVMGSAGRFSYTKEDARTDSAALATSVLGLREVNTSCVTAQGKVWGQKLCTVAGKDTNNSTVVTSMDCRSSGCVVRSR